MLDLKGLTRSRSKRESGDRYAVVMKSTQFRLVQLALFALLAVALLAGCSSSTETQASSTSSPRTTQPVQTDEFPTSDFLPPFGPQTELYDWSGMDLACRRGSRGGDPGLHCWEIARLISDAQEYELAPTLFEGFFWCPTDFDGWPIDCFKNPFYD